ncbi:hypothetical protein ElyMa_004990500 [Elysia marginata]|uniref:Uncharacterized protein n=1 Tax=Elysia marginata TaxID=1093978 RepID=A0AAV4J4K3_9GAST|nr:hypothetical protein ElyMa_004990500 [Elysia marginata]
MGDKSRYGRLDVEHDTSDITTDQSLFREIFLFPHKQIPQVVKECRWSVRLSGFRGMRVAHYPTGEDVILLVWSPTRHQRPAGGQEAVTVST